MIMFSGLKRGEKKGKQRKMSEPSKVIHVRNVGHEISELFQPFGVITKLVMLRAKNQALVQMQDVASAISVLQFYANVQPSISLQHRLYSSFINIAFVKGLRSCGAYFVKSVAMIDKIVIRDPYYRSYQVWRGRNVYVQFSSHQELTTIDQNSHGRGDEVFKPLSSINHARVQLMQENYFSLEELQVHYNNERTRDFTNPSLPSEPKGRSSQSGYVDAGGLYSLPATGASAVAFPQMANHAAIAAAFGGVFPPGVTGMNDRCTILVSNLNPDRIDEDKLFNLFSLYGNIVRIKLLRNKPDHALVQMSDGFQAELAVHFLKGAMLFGKRMDVNFSRYPNITPGADTREYLNSNLNRFNRNAAKNYRYCCSPTKMIHISTLPQDITEVDILNHLEEHGTILNTKIFETNGKKQALVLFESEEEATEALVCKNATSLGGSIIRISFSQSQSI
ncbi:hypothetical protein Cgig2_017566 [Carnegiea gigantea]|uniref:RRM domain-containing protein n=1 Tax=Carnegiea gigantea TaxID=171969 RepID=A0A9Q1KNJ0_9CARY|nr:hypothetical protein Cgig2_017566 [Carnegiea gigantea]